MTHFASNDSFERSANLAAILPDFPQQADIPLTASHSGITLDIRSEKNRVRNEPTLKFKKRFRFAPLVTGVVMNPGISPCPKHKERKTLYRAAILETNKSIISKRVYDAEEAVLARGREVFYGNCDPEEKEALEDALYALRAYKTAWQHAEAA